jgi:hypothetical protein
MLIALNIQSLPSFDLVYLFVLSLFLSPVFIFFVVLMLPLASLCTLCLIGYKITRHSSLLVYLKSLLLLLMRSLDVSVDLIVPTALWPCGRLSP